MLINCDLVSTDGVDNDDEKLGSPTSQPSKSILPAAFASASRASSGTGMKTEGMEGDYQAAINRMGRTTQGASLTTRLQEATHLRPVDSVEKQKWGGGVQNFPEEEGRDPS